MAAPEPDIYDIVIIGSGLGGLLCGAILSREGYRVCILEKNRQYGGCLQSFSREKALFDSGVHYVGSLAAGQTLHQVFRYAGIMQDLPAEQMDAEVFDRIVFLEDGREYDLAQGYENFIQKLAEAFPGEKEAIENYSRHLQEVCSRFPLYHLQSGGSLGEKMPVLEDTVSGKLSSFTANRRLQEVLAGNNLLYAGREGITPFYVHALVLNSFISSSWKIRDGGSQITRLLVKQIRAQKGELYNHCKVVSLEEDAGKIKQAHLEDGRVVKGRTFISNLHPRRTLALTKSSLLRPAYRKRIEALPDTISSFCVYAVLKPGVLRYEKHNYYLHAREGVWKAIDCDPDRWPQTCFVYFTAASGNSGCADAITLMTYMPFSWVEQWSETFNTDAVPGDRGDSYAAFKQEKEKQLIALVEQHFPGLSSAIQSVYSSSPLSYRDYIGTSDGSLYGVAKDARDPVGGFIAAQTRIPNLYLTGQNLLLHGLMGVAMSALQTCGHFTDLEKLLEKIRHA